MLVFFLIALLWAYPLMILNRNESLFKVVKKSLYISFDNLEYTGRTLHKTRYNLTGSAAYGINTLMEGLKAGTADCRGICAPWVFCYYYYPLGRP